MSDLASATDYLLTAAAADMLLHKCAEKPERVDAETEQVAFEAFAYLHPHEAHAEWPDRFWAFFHAQFPDMTLLDMLALLKSTEGSDREVMA